MRRTVLSAVSSTLGTDRTIEVTTSRDVLAPGGRFRGNVALPPRFVPMTASAEALVRGVLKDELDVEYVVRYPIVEE